MRGRCVAMNKDLSRLDHFLSMSMLCVNITGKCMQIHSEPDTEDLQCFMWCPDNEDPQ